MTPAELSTMVYRLAAVRPPPIYSERALCDELELLITGRVEFDREFQISPKDRPDFVIGRMPTLLAAVPVVAVEVKIKGSLADLTRQLFRYAEHPDVAGILVVTTRADHQRLPDVILDRPVAVCYLGPLYL